MNLNLRPKEECTFDAVSLGEVMLRLDPGEGRIRTARSFRAWEGGGEYNVVRGLRRCFGLKTAVITAFADNEVGMLMEDFILQGGVDTSLIKWMETDGIGRTCRNGLNFTELPHQTVPLPGSRFLHIYQNKKAQYRILWIQRTYRPDVPLHTGQTEYDTALRSALCQRS